MARQEMLTARFWSRLMAPPSEERECVATLLVNMRDIEPRKEDDGFAGAFLSP